MIVVVGMPAWRAADPPAPAGRACAIALAAASHGPAVEIVGRAGDDASGDALMISLSTAGVGHVAVLRDPVRRTPILDPVAPDGPEQFVTSDDLPAEATPAPDDAPSLEPADVALGLKYLTTFAVLVVTDDTPPGVLPVALEAAAFTGAHLVLLLAPDAVAPDGLPPEGLPSAATVLAAPADDPEGAFAGLVGAYAAALDAGVPPAEAFEGALARGWENLAG